MVLCSDSSSRNMIQNRSGFVACKSIELGNSRNSATSALQCTLAGQTETKDVDSCATHAGLKIDTGSLV